jgi:hypothetical protein
MIRNGGLARRLLALFRFKQCSDLAGGKKIWRLVMQGEQPILVRDSSPVMSPDGVGRRDVAKRQPYASGPSRSC